MGTLVSGLDSWVKENLNFVHSNPEAGKWDQIWGGTVLGETAKSGADWIWGRKFVSTHRLSIIREQWRLSIIFGIFQVVNDLLEHKKSEIIFSYKSLSFFSSDLIQLITLQRTEFFIKYCPICAKNQRNYNTDIQKLECIILYYKYVYTSDYVFSPRNKCLKP